MAREIVCVGSCNMDLFAYVPRLPSSGESIRGHRSHIGCGGKGANQALMAARLGASVAMIGKVGSDDFGKTFVAAFTQAGMDTSHLLVTSEAATGTAQIWVDDQGANSIVIIPSANALLSVEDVRAAAPTIQGAKVLLTQLEVNQETTLESLRLARAAGVLTVLNTAPGVPDLDKVFYGLADIVCPNETELSLLTGGMPVQTTQEVEAAARTLQDKGCATVLVTLGDRGALLLPKDQPATLIETDKVKAVDTSGAGDAFLGTLAAQLARGVGLEQAVRVSCRVASVTVQRAGTQDSYPQAHELPHDLQLPPQTS